MEGGGDLLAVLADLVHSNSYRISWPSLKSLAFKLDMGCGVRPILTLQSARMGFRQERMGALAGCRKSPPAEEDR